MTGLRQLRTQLIGCSHSNLEPFTRHDKKTAENRRDLAALQEATVDEVNGRLSRNFSSVHKLPLGEKATLFCAVDEESQRDSKERQALSTLFTLEVCDD